MGYQTAANIGPLFASVELDRQERIVRKRSKPRGPVVNHTTPEHLRDKASGDCVAVLAALVEHDGVMTADALCAQTTRRAAARVYDLKKFHNVGIACTLEPVIPTGKKHFVYRLDNLAHARSLLKQWGALAD
jgi:hypothetical protein